MITKKCALSLGGFALTMLICFMTMHVMSLFTLSKWVGVSVSVGIFGVMLILTIVIKKNRAMPFIVIPLNAFADGLALSSLYVHLGKFPEIWETAAIFGALMLALFIYCLLTNIPFFRNHFIISMSAYCVLLFAALIVAAVVNDTAKNHPQIFYLAFLGMIPFIAFLITTAASAENAYKHVRNMAFSSFAALLVIIIAVIIIISQGDGLDGIGDGITGVDGVGGTKRKRNPYDYNMSLLDIVE